MVTTVAGWRKKRMITSQLALLKTTFFVVFATDVCSFCLGKRNDIPWFKFWIHLTENCMFQAVWSYSDWNWTNEYCGSSSKNFKRVKMAVVDFHFYCGTIFGETNLAMKLGGLAQVWTLQRCSAYGGGEFPCIVYGWERLDRWRLLDAIWGWGVLRKQAK